MNLYNYYKNNIYKLIISNQISVSYDPSKDVTKDKKQLKKYVVKSELSHSKQ